MAVAFVQANSGASTVATSSFPVSFNFAQPVGRTNLVFTYCNTPGAKFIHGVTDTVNSNYFSVGWVQDATNHRLECWCATNVAANAANTVTVSMPNYPSVTVFIAEYSGVDTVLPVGEWGFDSGTVSPGAFSLDLSHANSLVVAFLHENTASTMVPTAPLATRLTSTTLQLQDGLFTAAGAQTPTVTVSSGQWVMIGCVLNAVGVTAPSLAAYTLGEVLYNGTQIGTTGQDTGGTTIANLADAEGTTSWTTAINSAWGGVDAGIETILRRVRITAKGGREDSCIQCQIHGSNDPLFLSGTNLLTTSGPRPPSGTLLKEFLINQRAITPYRYYRWYANNLALSLSDLDFIGLYKTGVVAQPVQPVITPIGGGQFYQPTNARATSLTTGVTIRYTLDATVPTGSSSTFTTPLRIVTSAQLNAVAINATIGTSRVTTSYFYIGPTFHSGVERLDDRNYRVTSRSGCFFHDPVGGFWYEYKENLDATGYRTSGYQGFNVYRSADLMNWDYAGNICGPAPGAATNNTAYLFRPFVCYNATSHLYVLWATPSNGTTGIHVFTSPTPDGSAPWTDVAQYTTATGLGGQAGPFGDLGGFIDDAGTPYLIFNHSNNTRVCYAKLTSNYLNVDIANLADYATGGEAWTIFRRGAVYFSLASGQAGNAYSGSTYGTSSSPIGPWTGNTNPFQTVTGVGAVAPGNSYQSQTDNVIKLPGRGDCFIYCGDRIQAPLGFTTESRATKIFIPMVFSSATAFTMTWGPGTWFDGSFSSPFNFDAIYPPVSGVPVPPSNLAASDTNATWTNNDPTPHNLYLESAGNLAWTIGAVSEVVPTGASSLTYFTNNTFFRLRAVNANGSSLSDVTNINASYKPITVSSGAVSFETIKRVVRVLVNTTSANVTSLPTIATTPVLLDKFGFSTHFDQAADSALQANQLIPALIRTGAGWIRDDINWGTGTHTGIETTAGVYNFANLQPFWAIAAANGLKCVAVINSNPTAYPPTDTYNQTGMVNFCKALITHLPAGTVLEITNEPNNDYQSIYGSATWKAQLAALTNAVTAGVHSVSPSTQVIGLGAQGSQITTMLTTNGANPDGVVYHPYDLNDDIPEHTFEPPDTIYETWVANLRAVTNKPLWETERNLGGASGEYNAACWNARRMSISFALGIEHSFLYDFYDQSGVQTTLNNPLFVPMQSYFVVQRVLAQIGTMPPTTVHCTTTSPNAAFTSSASNFKSFVFDDAFRTVAVVWFGNLAPLKVIVENNTLIASGNVPPRTATIAFPHGLMNEPIQVLDSVTGSLTFRPISDYGPNGLTMTVTDRPQFITIQ